MRLDDRLKGIDYSQPVFFSEQVGQQGYDREIDEGMSSGLKRYVTLEVSGLAEKQTTGLLERLLNEAAADFPLCKNVVVQGFNKDGKKYLTVSGECHARYVAMTRDFMKERIEPLVKGLPMKFIEEYVALPGKGQPYTIVNFGPYGTTGCPALDIPQHPAAIQ